MEKFIINFFPFYHFLMEVYRIISIEVQSTQTQIYCQLKYQQVLCQPTRHVIYTWLQQGRQMLNSTAHKILSSIEIRVRSFKCSSKGELILTISTRDIQTGNSLQDVHRTLKQIQNLNNYIIGCYGGYIIPMLDSEITRKLRNFETQIQQIMDIVEAYLIDLKDNSYAGADQKYYCFLFQQAMILPTQQLFTKVLRSASKISKKYLNAIFTRKQLPQEKSMQILHKNFICLSNKYVELSTLKQISQCLINQQHTCQQILTMFSELSGQPSSSPCPHQPIIIQTEKLIRTADKYMLQATQAYERWQMLIERVRELQNNLYKGLHEDEGKYKAAAAELKKWTSSLSEEMKAMEECFVVFNDCLIRFVGEIKWGSGLALQEQQSKSTLKQKQEKCQNDDKQGTKKQIEIQSLTQMGTQHTLDQKLEYCQ